MLINAKFASACLECGRTCEQGSRVAWNPGQKGVRHASCSDEGKKVLAAVHASKATTSDVHLPCPEGLAYLPFQRAGIAYALQAAEGTIFGDEMGLGKTVQAIGFLNAQPKMLTALIVCPASLKLNWKNECLKWLARPAIIRIVGEKSTYENALMSDENLNNFLEVVIVNYDQLKKVGDFCSDVVVLDEAHYIKNPKAARTKLAHTIAKRAKRRLVLTGTPILSRPVDLWSLLQVAAPSTWDPAGNLKSKAVGPGEGAGFFRFAKRYCDAREEWVSRTKKVWLFDGATNLEELQEKLRSSCLVRRLKKDVLTELPAKRRQVVTLTVDGAEEALEAEDAAWNASGYTVERALSNSKVAFEDISRVRREVALAKVPAVLAHVRDALESSQKVVLFAHHKEVIQALTDGLRETVGYPNVVTLTGENSQGERAEAVERFQNGDARVFIGSITAAGVGLTLTAASHVIFAELTWTPAEVAQAEDRCHRIGQTDSVLVQHMVLDGSLDQRIAEVLIAKQEVADLALDAATIKELSPETPAEQFARAQKRAEEWEGITPGEAAKLLTSLRFLASRCDGAREFDGQGFNRLDSAFGIALSSVPYLTAKQAVAAKRMLQKYSRQLSEIG